ncbi:MAG TPA: hypothetical protein V6D17_03830 [Candidatus Obscuribacterales bacterium]
MDGGVSGERAVDEGEAIAAGTLTRMTPCSNKPGSGKPCPSAILLVQLLFRGLTVVSKRGQSAAPALVLFAATLVVIVIARCYGATPTRLSGGVVHSEVLDPVPSTQRPGRVFRPVSVSPGSMKSARRFKVPDWLAGIWQRSEAREVSRIELPSGRVLKPVGRAVARVNDAFGTYRDKNGQVWQIFDPVRAHGQVDRGAAIDYHRVHTYDLIITGPKSAVVEVQATHTLVSKSNHKILNVYQDEELNKYSPLPDGRLATDSSVKVFDMDGKPILLTRTVSNQVRLPPKTWPLRTVGP